jgi:hypothetical protein
MKTFARAVISGFAFTLGATLCRKLVKKLGFEEDTGKGATAAAADAVTSPSSGDNGARDKDDAPLKDEATLLS